jgi:hypothetical protein
MEYAALNSSMTNDELDMTWKEVVVGYSMYYPSIFQKVSRKIIKTSFKIFDTST